MADPVTATIGGIGMVAGAAGSLISGVGAVQSADARARMDQYQAGVAARNAQIALQNSEYASQKGEQDAQKYGMGAAQRQGQIVAAQGSSGLDVNSGSAKEVQDSQRFVTNMDLTQIRSNAAKVAYDYRNESINQTNKATMYLAGAADEERGAEISATSSILGAASSVSSRWLQASNLGMFGGGGGGRSQGYNDTGYRA